MNYPSIPGQSNPKVISPLLNLKPPKPENSSFNPPSDPRLSSILLSPSSPLQLELEIEWRNAVLNTPRVGKLITPGRCIMISTTQFPYHVAVVVPSSGGGETFSVIVVHEGGGWSSGIAAENSGI